MNFRSDHYKVLLYKANVNLKAVNTRGQSSLFFVLQNNTSGGPLIGGGFSTKHSVGPAKAQQAPPVRVSATSAELFPILRRL